MTEPQAVVRLVAGAENAGHLGERDAYVINGGACDQFGDVAERLGRRPSARAGSLAVVVVVPKTVSARRLTKAIGQRVPAD